ncbi:hypothetical protein [Candidatus Magnetominusculus dajiuhuensis]|uniref:hypothetical protein n=1 Tax=Candidatus Magnetominusculus dajiuhuensis TaxID=3137712 RepID=UPI003B42DF08
MASVGSLNTNSLINALQGTFGTATNSSATAGASSGAGSASNSSASSSYQVNLSSLALNLMSGIVSNTLTASPLDALGQNMRYLNMTTKSQISPTLANSLVNPAMVNSINLNSYQSLSNTLNSLSGTSNNANAVQQSGLLNTSPSTANSITGTNLPSTTSSQGSQPVGNQALQAFSKIVRGLLTNPNPIISLTG